MRRAGAFCGSTGWLAARGSLPLLDRRLVVFGAGDAARFCAEAEHWPADLRDHAYRLAEPAFVRS